MRIGVYYGFLGDWAEGVAIDAPRSPEAVRERAAAFGELGVDELSFDPPSPTPPRRKRPPPRNRCSPRAIRTCR